MDLHIEEKTAIVTGGSKGIGRGIADALAKEGCNLVICARHKKELTKSAQKLRQKGVEVLAVEADLTNDDDIQRLIDQTVEKFSNIDILINDAGTIGNDGSFEELSTGDWRTVFELNLFAVVTLTRKVVPYMKKQSWGRIINISSENGRQPYPDMIHYSASKGALENFSKALSKQYAAEGILVNTVSPAFIETPLVNEMMKQSAKDQGITKEEMVEQFLDNNRPHIELKRSGKIEEVGPLVAFLCSDKASFIVGSNYRIDGGSVASV